MIKKLLLTLAVAAMAVSSSACTALGAAGAVVQATTSSTPLGDAITMDERGMYAVNALYNIPASAYVSADRHGLITPELRAQVRPLLQTAYAALLAAREAYRLGDATSWNGRVAALQALKTRITDLIPERTNPGEQH